MIFTFFLYPRKSYMSLVFDASIVVFLTFHGIKYQIIGMWRVYDHVISCFPNRAVSDRFICIFRVVVKKEKPRFLKKPADQDIMETEEATFEATVSVCKPEPRVEW